MSKKCQKFVFAAGSDSFRQFRCPNPVGSFSTQFLRKQLVFPPKCCVQGFQVRGAHLEETKLLKLCDMILNYFTIFDAVLTLCLSGKSLQGFGHLRQFFDIFRLFLTFCHDSGFLGCPTICPLQNYGLQLQ